MSLSDFSRHRVEDIKKALLQHGLGQIEVDELKGKSVVVQKAIDLGIQAIDIDVIDTVSPNPYKNLTFETKPEYASAQWNDYVMSLFEDDELDNGYPKVDGLRRVAAQLFGMPLESGPTQVFPSTSETHPGRATVVYKLVFNINGQLRTFSDVGDSYIGNTDVKYAFYAAAVASSRAEGRALRKLLALKVICADEITNDTASQEIARESISSIRKTVGEDLSEMELITDTQKKVITVLCGKIDVDVTAFINTGSLKYNNIDEVKKDTAVKMIQKLNTFVQKPSEIPALIKIKKGN